MYTLICIVLHFLYLYYIPIILQMQSLCYEIMLCSVLQYNVYIRNTEKSIKKEGHF